jgi:hypothetical protein
MKQRAGHVSLQRTPHHDCIPPGRSHGLFEIVVDGDEYLNRTIPMALPLGLMDDDPLSPANASNHRSVVGCIGYMASAIRPDLSLEASMSGRTFMKPTLRHARKANAVLAWAKEQRFNLRFKKGTECLTAFVDSAGPNDCGTQEGRVFALTCKNSHRVAAWVYWESRKVKRVCRSTAKGEILSLGEGYDTSMWLKPFGMN